MAFMKRVNEDSVNQVNFVSKFAKLSTNIGPLDKQKRAAFIEVGNNISAQKIFENSTSYLGIKKCTATALPFKETKKIPNRNVNVAAISNQESIAVDEITELQRYHPGPLSPKQLCIIDLQKLDVEFEYILETLSHLRSLEDKYDVKEGFLEGQETTPKMRAILVRWLIEVHARFDLEIETLHICVGTIDRYLQANKNVGRNFLQLVGSTALLVACKYEETGVPAIDDLVSMCESAFSKKHFLTMEVQMMKELDHCFGRPTSVQFLKSYNEIAQVSNDHDSLGMFMLELALVDYDMSHINPSLQAAAACCLSLGILNEEMDLSAVWTPILVHCTNYEYGDLKEVLVSLAVLIKSRSSKVQFIRAKYDSPIYDYISSSSKLNGSLVQKLAITTRRT